MDLFKPDLVGYVLKLSIFFTRNFIILLCFLYVHYSKEKDGHHGLKAMQMKKL
jgi:hypothetical protein